MLRRFSLDGDLSHINSIEFRRFAATCICCPVAQDVVHQHVEWHSKQTLIEGPGTEEQKSSPSFLSFGDRSLLLCGPSAAQNKHWGLQGCHFLDRRSHKSCQTMTFYDSQEMFGTWNSEINCHDWTFSLDFLKNQIKHLLSDAFMTIQQSQQLVGKAPRQPSITKNVDIDTHCMYLQATQPVEEPKTECKGRGDARSTRTSLEMQATGLIATCQNSKIFEYLRVSIS